MNSIWCYCPELLNSGQNWRFFVQCDHKIWGITLKNNRAPLLCYIELCATFHSHQWIQTKVTVWKSSIWVKICNFLSCVTFKFDGWPWNIIGHPFYFAASSVHHFIAIGEFKLKLQSGNARCRSKSAIYSPVWPSNLTDDLENSRPPLLCCCKLCASLIAIGEFKLKLQSGNAQIGTKSTIFCPMWLWNLTNDLEKQ